MRNRAHHPVLVIAVALLATAAVMGPGTTPADAHGSTISFTLADEGGGRIRAMATWAADGHPVDVPIDATLTATQDAPPVRLGPARMTAVPGETSVYVSLLPVGHWDVDVRSAEPAPGFGHALIDVDPGATRPPPDFPPAAFDDHTAVDAIRAWTPRTICALLVGFLFLVTRTRRTRSRSPTR
ncbi:hypothetical protein Lfu02_59500 [Longispora fulva]|uniref:YtkA-like domain-containing protein n=1 Tax=Longispora fulva TaxID=619741 RepID=A0A8J7GRV1_9ACTN|nr:hypothetical protein [Longispora fulva]MBG6137068.1 hypothetical protein [Longispora fulva]GIG61578.1 hypothetical protein Lfu02_59500 [Longispora fulva]